MSKGPKKVLLTPKEQEQNALRIFRKPKAEKVVITAKASGTFFPSFKDATIDAKPKAIYGRVLSVEEAEQVGRQPFHNKGKNRKVKSTSRR